MIYLKNALKKNVMQVAKKIDGIEELLTKQIHTLYELQTKKQHGSKIN